MSRSKEGREREQTAGSTAQPAGSRSTTFDERLGARGQTDYTPGRESYRDFPRRSTSMRARDEYQSRDIYREPYRGRYSSRYDEERRYGRAPYDEPRGRADRYRETEREHDYGRAYRSEREPHADPYNREAIGGRYGRDRQDYEPSLGRYDREERLERYERNLLRSSDLMTKDVTTCAPQTSIREVADKMEDDDVGSIPVVENGRLVGIVTDRDIVCRIVAEGRDTRTTPVAEAMSQDIVTCLPDDTVLEVIRKMAEHQIRRIPVTDINGRLRGIIAMADIALEAERDRDLAHALEEISRPTPNRSRRV